MKDIKKDLWEMKYIHGLSRIEYCPENEQKDFKAKRNSFLSLPEDVLEDEYGEFYRYVDEGLSEREVMELLKCRELEMLNKMHKGIRAIKVALIAVAIVLGILVLAVLFDYVMNQLYYMFL